MCYNISERVKIQMIELKNVSKIYNERERNEVKALQNISLKIKKGEFAAIMGPSGSGKSTLMHIIGCLDHPTRGQYFLDNENVKKLSGKKLAQIRNQKVGFVFQTFNLLPRTTALENVLIPLYYSKKKINRIQKAKKIIKKLGLEDRASHFTNELSGGEQQRFAIARALVNDAEIILADEPTGNLDTKTGEKILKILKQLNKTGITIILVTHENNIAAAAKKIIKIKDGKIIGA